jgi:hypothetical protein
VTQALYDQLTKVIRQLKGSIRFAEDHIQIDRAYREISVRLHLRRALNNGRVTSVDTSRVVAFWQGEDPDGRLLELWLCLLDSTGTTQTLVPADVKFIWVDTAYKPGTKGKPDDELKAAWLTVNSSEWEDSGNDGVKRKAI